MGCGYGLRFTALRPTGADVPQNASWCRTGLALDRARLEQWTGLQVEVADLVMGAVGVGIEFELFAREEEELDIGAVEPGQIAVLLRQDRERIGVE